MDSDNLRTWWNKSVPVTKHPLEDATKWCVDSWILDGEGVNTRLCAMIQGQFEESEYHIGAISSRC
jgi:nuclear RNA export factor